MDEALKGLKACIYMILEIEKTGREGTSLTGRPNVSPERVALTASHEPRRGAPEIK